MAKFVIEGGHTLAGEITPQGAKNEALQIISAVLLTPSEVIIGNIPNIRDVNKLIEILEDFGVKVKDLGNKTKSFIANDINLDYLDSETFKEKAASLRGSIMLLGPLLARFGKGKMPKPGGDKIGRRRVDTHFQGFQEMGAQFSFEPKESFFSITADKLYGVDIHLEEASVTGTANIIMAAVLAEGRTTIYNAACEPYLQQLCRMLNSMGAKIEGIKSNYLIINGVKNLGGCEHRMLPDMIEIGSFIGLAAMTQSEIRIKDVSWENLGVIPRTFQKLGIRLIKDGDDMIVPKQDSYQIESFIDGSIMTIADAPWPGLTPDLLSIILVVSTQAKGSVLIHQKMFESRLFFVDKLIDMGAQVILCDPHRATVIGLDRMQALRATNMASPDIRAGVALLIAALSANGVSSISNIDQIDRGYEDIDKRLQAIGAKISRVEE
ncbi:UDP-N-acetylglucosamine 1-carboxyvinyltransferase [Halosquirtibacter laminarini]|uniref:UDP-N-acetylglucosamine 1-carboxyvinyltransferase n=1 Tax=Halosquirtibacter laminarini TaxID=3374600 RepID=A0AC61NCJ8_9BACT|nr:UDP-N-acetylglucosamine 1-carboxyvinyltransferase [Prolixibacteraceae bacterium]